ncbi:MAG: gamma-glutamylcyclotransferase [Deltaproteobacteria bacterium]|nr:gamma-glutamylcyclotransferase [Deltaproteobacteria bacterium]
MNLFIYGSLLNGMSGNPVLSDTHFLGVGFTTGHPYDLAYDFGDYPTIESENGSAYGELYDIDSKKLKTLDKIKGYNPKAAQHSLYVRKEINCILLNDGSQIDAFAYFYNHPLKTSRIIRGDINDIFLRIFLKSGGI